MQSEAVIPNSEAQVTRISQERASGGERVRPLKVLFFDLNDPLDPSNWSGTPAQIFRCMELAGVEVVKAGPHYVFIRKSINWILHRYYRFGKKLFYHIDRDRFWTRAFTELANWSLREHCDADAIVTAFPAFTSFVRRGLPIFMIHDATWGQVIESYPWFARSHQPRRIVENGFDLERIAYQRDDVFPVMTSEWAANRAVADYGIDPAKISVLSLGPNMEHPPSGPEVQSAIRSRGNGTCRLLFVGKEWIRKGGPFAVEATAALIKLGVRAELHVVGPQELATGSAAAAALPGFVHNHGFLRKFVPEEAEILNKLFFESDFFILPTQAEALGVVFAEAAAFGLPSLGTSVGGVPSVLHDGIDGAIFPPTGSSQQMAEWMQAHYVDRSKYEQLAFRAREDYESRLSSLAFGTQLAQIIRSRIHGRATASDPHTHPSHVLDPA